ncbi:deoxyribonuclease IV [Fimbriiglobus ruber]|uniref:Probable endonuclease 4 n=1 Tax=Fimbriiglobus ruber TaxID=1908690 RepID=A0A225E2Q7_9BACT|nr:deoxyribonuclease IV [Fimbriiglobus ruber]OWK43769.1 Endonuclease IV [Fimbriiglobus ruber]
MPLFGAHLSVAGGLHRAIEAAVDFQCETVQIFTKNASQWAGKPLIESEIDTFRTAVRKAKLKFPTAHDSYLINLAAPGDELYQKSIAALADELVRAEALGLTYLVTHPGAHVGSGEEAGLARVAAGLDEAHRRCEGFKVKILLETTAGQGSTLGHRFEHLARLLDAVAAPERLGVCLDTCHVFAAGYDLTTDEGYDAVFQEFDHVIGLKWLKLFHLNDSVKPFGSRVDRHAGLGLGHIGENAFRKLVTDLRFRTKPMILETPKEGENGEPMDPVNLGKLRMFLEEG